MVTFPRTITETIPSGAFQGFKGLASISDVARYVGCSTSTVSRVVNNRDAVHPVTRKRVHEAIQKLQYKPSLTAVGLRMKQGRLLGLAVPESTSAAFTQIIQFSLEAAYKNGYNLILVNTHEDPELEERYITDLLRRDINGIIFSRVSDESHILARILEQNIPIVVIDRGLAGDKAASVVLDNQKAGYIAGRHLAGLGHRNLACVTGPLRISLCRDRLNGFQKALAEEGFPLPDSAVFEGDFKLGSGISAAEWLLRDRRGFSGVWAMNDVMALGMIKQMQQQGVRIPEDISLLGMDDSEIAEMVSPSLTTVHYPLEELADKAFEILFRQIETNTRIVDTVILQPRLTIRDSTTRVKEPVK